MNREISRVWSFILVFEVLFLAQIIMAASSWAGGFQYPVNANYILRYERVANAGEWYDYQPFGSLFNYPDRVHLGADINKAGGDAGEPVYAVNDCIVSSWDDTSQPTDWGKWIILRCDAASGSVFILTDGSTTSRVFVLYAHLGEIKIYADDGRQVSPSQLSYGFAVRRGWRIGTIGNANGLYGSAYHLHFEVRPHGLDQVGHGYLSYDNWSYTEINTDPIEFIENNFFTDSFATRVIVHPYDLEDRGTVSLALNSSLWHRVGRTSVSGSSVGYGNYLWTAACDKGGDASWYFTLQREGWYDLYLFIPRTIATATQVNYIVWHEGTGRANPYKFTISQSGNSTNHWMFIGTFKFSARWKYAMVIEGKTKDADPKTVAIDAIELIPTGTPNIGGSIVPADDRDQDDVDDSWESSFGLNPSDPHDAALDRDSDGLTAMQEYRFGTNPFKADTDEDGSSDGEEVQNGTDPLDASDFVVTKKDDDTKDKVYDDPITKPSRKPGKNSFLGEDTVGGCASGGVDVPFLILLPLLVIQLKIKQS